MPSVRLIKHETVPKCGSYEIRFSDGRPSKFVYWEDLPGHWLLVLEKRCDVLGPRLNPFV